MIFLIKNYHGVLEVRAMFFGGPNGVEITPKYGLEVDV